MARRALGKVMRPVAERRTAAQQLATDDVLSRRAEILAAAARLFKRNGYGSVTIRQIADAAGILSGSLYHHFASKREMYLELHREELQRAAITIGAAVEKFDDPWDRLEAAITTHLSLSLDPNFPTMLLSTDKSALASEMRAELVRDRNKFERLYKDLVANLPLPGNFDRDVFRIALMSLLNNTPKWYRDGRLSPEQVAKHLFRILRV